jgi:hypothetical protein
MKDMKHYFNYRLEIQDALAKLLVTAFETEKVIQKDWDKPSFEDWLEVSTLQSICGRENHYRCP